MSGSSTNALLFGALNPPLHVADGVGVFVDLVLIARRRARASGPRVSRSPNPGCSCAAASALRAPRDPCCRCRRTASRTRRAGCIPSAAAAWGSSTTACACRRSSAVPVHAPALAGASIDSSSDATCVSLAKCRASSWSIETSAMISISFVPPLAVPVRNDPDAPAWM